MLESFYGNLAQKRPKRAFSPIKLGYMGTFLTGFQTGQLTLFYRRPQPYSPRQSYQRLYSELPRTEP